MSPDATSLALAAFLTAHPVTMTDSERRIHEAAFEVEPPEVDEDSQRGDMADWASARRYGR